jgi:hypothetical protein
MTSGGSHFKRWVFSRHSNPWSAWTRWATTPLVVLPVWNRSARQGGVVAAWFAVNAVVFPPPRDDSAFATRVVLGEERWLKERPSSGAVAIDCIASAALLIAIDGARRHRRCQMTIATIGTMGALLWYWREMVRFYDTRTGGRSTPAPPPGTSGGNAGRPRRVLFTGERCRPTPTRLLRERPRGAGGVRRVGRVRPIRESRRPERRGRRSLTRLVP